MNDYQRFLGIFRGKGEANGVRFMSKESYEKMQSVVIDEIEGNLARGTLGSDFKNYGHTYIG